jgi:large subunit ribosomal protein L6
MKKKNIIKIPKNITLIYSTEKKIITIIGLNQTKSLKLDIKPVLDSSNNKIEITNISFKKLANHQKKNIKAFQQTNIALIKQLIIETSSLLYKKLIFTGIGYKVFDVEQFSNKLLMLKLGYSHFLYFKISSEIKMYCLKSTKLFIFSNSYQNVTQLASSIRAFKKPEPYKGKGILYSTEKVILKEGKKV